jgi:hypothetical protein
MQHSDLKEMCGRYGLYVYLVMRGINLAYSIRYPGSGTWTPDGPTLATITTTELYNMSDNELEELVVDCSVRSMEGLC